MYNVVRQTANIYILIGNMCLTHQPLSQISAPWGGDARRGARGEGKPQKTLQSPSRLYKAPIDYTKPQSIRQTKTIRAPKGPGSGNPPHY